ncbi:MAG: hypothetical protein HGB02_09455 [Chlorobiaceae bacterium]|nr:hypothetical protein [Chlorobiaceae bacterium]
MKKSAKILALAVALFSGFGAASAQAEGFKTGVDLVSSYVWRGSELGNSPAIQPTLSYTLDNGVVIGAWGSYAVLKDKNLNTEANVASDYRYQEVDLSVTIPAGPFSLALVDYYIPNLSTTNTKAFDFSKTGPNVIEANVTYSAGDLSLLGAYNLTGADAADSHAYYGEGSYKFYNGKDGFSAKAVVGAGSKYFYGGVGGTEKKLALVNTGISVAKDRYTASYVYNPISEKSSLVFMASF